MSEAGLAFEVRRKLLHLVPLIFPLLSTFGIVGRRDLRIVLGACALVTVLIDTMRRKYGPAGKIFSGVFGSFLRHGEKANPIASIYFFAGMFLSLLFFRSPIAEASMYILILGDTMAALAGMAWGRTKVWGKSLEGSFAFVVSSFLALLLLARLEFPVMVTGVLVGAAVELLPLPVNDNLTIPLSAGLSMSLVSNFS